MAGGSQIIINKDGITITTPRKFEAKAGQHIFKAGENIPPKLPILPDAENPYILQYLVKNKENQPVANRPYFIINEDGELQKGVTDHEGFMTLNTTPSTQNIVTRVMLEDIEEAQDANNLEE